MTKLEQLTGAIQAARTFRPCGPSDDSDEQTAVAVGFRHMLVQIQRLGSPVLSAALSARLNAIGVDVNSIYSVYDANAELDALLPDLEAAIEEADEASLDSGTPGWLVEPGLVDQLAAASSETWDTTFLVEMCREINSSFAHDNFVASVLLMRAVLNYLPPLFGHQTFRQVVANSDKSHKSLFTQLEEGLRKVADFQTHRGIGKIESTASEAQVAPFMPPLDMLLKEALVRLADPVHSDHGGVAADDGVGRCP